MLKLIEDTSVVERAPRETAPGLFARAKVDRVSGDPDLAAMLDAMRGLLGVESVAMHLIAASGELGQLLAGVGPESDLTNWSAEYPDRLTAGSAGFWLPSDGERVATHVSLLEPRARDRIALFCRPRYGDLVERRDLERQVVSYLPLIERTIAQWARAHVQAQRLREQEAAFNAVGFGLLVVDADCHVQTMNAAARTLLAGSTALSVSGNRLTLLHLEDAMRFQVSLRHVLSSAVPGGETITVAASRSGKVPLLLAISAMPTSGTGGRLATVQIIDPAAELALPLETLSLHYDLTRVEVRLIEQLVRGKTLVEAATAMRLKEQTARTYLKHIFQKTGLRRQVELVRMVLAGATPKLRSAG